jgi:hypothetical protein
VTSGALLDALILGCKALADRSWQSLKGQAVA